MGKTAVKERKPEPETATVECRHHWIIESPRGAISRGRCKRCGMERDFRNSANDYIWDDDSGSGYGGIGSVKPTAKAALDDEDGLAAAGTGSGRTALTV